MENPVTIFVSYAHKDASYLQELLTFLKPFVRNKVINIWTDKDIVAGQQWNELIKARLGESKVILFLVSPDFLASDYIQDSEVKNALENHQLIIIPILIRPIDLSLLQLNYLQLVPSGARAVADWESRDKAWNDVIGALKIVFNQIIEKGSRQPVSTENGSGQKMEVSKNLNLKTGNFTDNLVKWLCVLLIVVSLISFVYTSNNLTPFYIYTSLAGMATGFGAYFIARRF